MTSSLNRQAVYAGLLHFVVACFFAILNIASPALADDLSDRDAFWRQKTFSCIAISPSFPSKEVLGQPQDCEDGDMTLFNGLLCTAGENAGCDAVARAQGPDGRWWRSPRRIGWEAPTHDVSFSPDQSLGVMLYAVQTRDSTRFARWLAWIESNRPCLVTIGNSCIKYGWLRFCTDDADKRCTLRPDDCVNIEQVAIKLGVDGTLCRRIMHELGLSDDALKPLGDFLLASSAVNDPGFPQHLAAVHILLALRLGVDTAKAGQAATILATRTANNPFFAYLNEGATPSVVAAVLSTCPAQDRPSSNRFQWTWERVMKPNSWGESMYWECIFLGDLMRATN